MLRYGLARQLIANIPEYMGGLDVVPGKGEHKAVVELIPVRGHLVNYRSDVWDFSSGFRYQKNDRLKVNFKKADPQFKDLLKDFAAQLIDTYSYKISTIKGRVDKLTAVFNKALETSGLFILVDTDAITGTVETLFGNTEEKRDTYVFVTGFLQFLREDRGLITPVDLEAIRRIMISYGHCISRKRVYNTHKNVPEEYFNAIVRTADRVMRDEREPFNMRMTAGIILTDTQLGLRQAEVLALETDCISGYLCSDGKERPYCTYNCIKAARADTEVVKIKTFCTPLLYDTVEYLNELRKQCDGAEDTDFIYVLNWMPGMRKPVTFPISPGSFIHQYKNFFYRYLREYTLKEWRGIRKVKVVNTDAGAVHAIPTVQNIRVHFATSLYRQGFPLDFIESVMSHTPSGNNYDSYYDIDDDEYRRARLNMLKDEEGPGPGSEDEFEAFLDSLAD